MNIDEKGWLYGKWQIRHNFWAITNRFTNIMYLLVGEDRALLIDTGYGEGNIRAFIETITQKSLVVVNTHGHFDHTGGNGWWPEVYMAEGSFADCRHTFLPIHDEWFHKQPYPDYRVHFLHDGDILDIGGQQIEILSIPAHHGGSIALLDKKNHVLFTGDELESGQVLLLTECKAPYFLEVVKSHLDNMKKLKARRAEFDFLCPAHNGLMLWPDAYIEDFISLDNELLAGTATVMPDTAGFGFPPDPVASGSVFGRYGRQRRAVHGLASFIYLDNE